MSEKHDNLTEERKAELARAAGFSVADSTGADFWKEVERQLTPSIPKVDKRPQKLDI